MSDFISAAKIGDVQRVKQCLTSGADVDTRDDKEGSSALYWASCHNSFQVCDLLIRSGADVNLPNNLGSTPLHAAADRGHKECVFLLIRSGATLNAQNTSNWDTPLHLAAYRGHLDVCRMLLDHGSMLTTTNKQNRTALQEAQSKGEYRTFNLLTKYFTANAYPPRTSRPNTEALHRFRDSEPHPQQQITEPIFFKQNTVPNSDHKDSRPGHYLSCTCTCPDHVIRPTSDPQHMHVSEKLNTKRNIYVVPPQYAGNIEIAAGPINVRDRMNEIGFENLHVLTADNHLGYNRTSGKNAATSCGEPHRQNRHELSEEAIKKLEQRQSFKEYVEELHIEIAQLKEQVEQFQKREADLQQHEPTIDNLYRELQKSQKEANDYKAKIGIIQKELSKTKQDQSLYKLKCKQLVQELHNYKRMNENKTNRLPPSVTNLTSHNPGDSNIEHGELDSNTAASSRPKRDIKFLQRGISQIKPNNGPIDNTANGCLPADNDLHEDDLSEEIFKNVSSLLKIANNNLRTVTSVLVQQFNSLYNIYKPIPLDLIGEEWQEGRDFLLLDLLNTKTIGELDSPSSLLEFKIEHKSKIFVLKISDTIVGPNDSSIIFPPGFLNVKTETDILRKLPLNRNLPEILHQYEGSTQCLRSKMPEHLISLLDLTPRANFVVMKYYPSTLKSFIEQCPFRQPKNPEVIEQFACHRIYDLLNAVNYLWRNNIVHRKVWPGAIFLDNKLNAVLGDFSLAKCLVNQKGEEIEYVEKDQVYVGSRYGWTPELLLYHRLAPSQLPKKVTLKTVYKYSDAYAVARMFSHLLLSDSKVRIPQTESVHPRFNEEFQDLSTCYSSGLMNILNSIMHQTQEERISGDNAKCRLGILLFGRRLMGASSENDCKIWLQARMMTLLLHPAVQLSHSVENDDVMLTTESSVDANHDILESDFLMNTSASDIWWNLKAMEL